LIVTDASVVVEFLLGRARIIGSLTRELSGARDEALHALELIEPEALNSLRRLLRSGAISNAQADRAVAELGELRLVLYPHGPLRDRVWALRDNLTAYDALYLALAGALIDSVLVTSDAALAANAVRSLGDRRVRHLE
jgi:predicted nucleic acid-binding protein